MRKLIFLLVCVVTTSITNAQVVIQGRVLDNATNLPVPNASVYLNNTSVGAVTNLKGEFIFTATSIYTGELIVTCVGYERILYKLENAAAAAKSYTFKLAVKENELKEVLVLADPIRRQWLKIFMDNFLGITEEADNSTIQNLDAIYFTMGENKNTIYAYADTPLIIINKMLGYKISFDLIEFNFNQNKGSTYFAGYTRYEEMGDKKRWIKNRKLNYYGSTMHFYRSLINRELKEQGFFLFEIVKPNIKTDSIVKMTDTKMKMSNMSVAMPIEGSAILYIDSITNDYSLRFPYRLMVQYDRYPHAGFYLSSKTFVRGINPYGFTSYIDLLQDQVGLDVKGIVLSPLGLAYDGFWVYEKLANQLPFDYSPE